MEANELFSICQTLAMQAPNVGAVRRMHQLLVLCCGSQQGITFGNLFSQIDWLCKHHGIKTDDMIALQTARRHSNQTAVPSPEDWLYDLRAVALFISTLFAHDVPGSLLRLLPPANKPRERQPAVSRLHLRCIVNHCDSQTVWADTDQGLITIDYADHAYLQKILRPGMQLNLLEAHTEPLPNGEEVYRPKVIVVEPDFLVDISSLAACFTAYGHHPLLYTLNRLKPRPNTQATLLGNFAGTALDAIIHDPGAKSADVLRRSFHEQALRFCACPDFDAQKFKQQAEQQMQNIRDAVAHLSPLLAPLSPLLEPSFVCESLGLQGRVDLMTSDMSLLVEQKSGKNPKIEHQSHDSHGLQLESHYVQLLLYYGVLRYNFQKSDRQVDTRLLYSRYPARQGLLAVNYYRTLLREALRLRNQIVATDLLIARDGFGRILPLLRSDVVYKEATRDATFHNYIEPELTQLTTLLSHLTPLERSYYTTMLTFVYREQCCQKLGNAQARLHHSGGCTADLWQMPLSEKQSTGNIHTGLTIEGREKSSPYGGFDVITLTSSQGGGEGGKGDEGVIISNFRPGDMVYLYRYEGEPDVRHSILYKGTLQQIADGRLTVQLNDGQQDADLFPTGDKSVWAIEHGASDTSTNSQIRGLHQFVTGSELRRQLLLGQRPPLADPSQTLSCSYNAAYDNIVLRQKQARDYFLLQGPPGTGKTSMALRFMVLEELVTSGKSVLLTAYTNRAVDEICAMLTDTAINYLRIGGAPSSEWDALSSKEKTADTLDAQRRRIADTPVVVGTTSMLQARPYILEVKHFSLCIVDEASQILEPSIIGLLAHDHIGRFVLVGDHKQLPAVVQQSEDDARVSDPLLHAIGITDCRQSLFERLLRWEERQHRSQFTGVLSRQGRMHPDVALFPSSHFYHREQLCAVPCPHQQETALPYALDPQDALDRLLMGRRTLFIPVVPTELPDNDQSNEAEALMVATIAARIIRFYGDRFEPTATLGIIVPYRAQIAAIRQALSPLTSHLLPLPSKLIPLTIDTVERYQGSQRDVIIYCTTVSRRYQLDFLTQSTFTEDGQPIDRKLNVALTRARRQMIVVGNPLVLSHNTLFRQFIAQYGTKQQPCRPTLTDTL